MDGATSLEPPRLVRTPQFQRDFRGFRISWPEAGIPAALDAASAAVLDWFENPSTRSELAEDLVEVVGLELATAQSVAHSLIQTFLRGGQLTVAGATLRPDLYDYPPAASP